MESTYNEFQGTEFDPNLDFDFEDEGPNLWPVVGAAAGVAAAAGAALIIMGRRRNPTMADNAQELLEQASKEGKKSLQAVSKAVEDAKLDDILEQALHKARHAADGLDDSLEDLLKQAQKQAHNLAKDARKRGKQLRHDVEENVEELSEHLSKGAKTAGDDLSTLLQGAIAKAKDAASHVETPDIDLEDAVGDVRKRAKKAMSNGHAPDIDGKKIEHFLDDLKTKLVETVGAALSEAAPKVEAMKNAAADAAQTVAHKMQDDVMPAAQDAAEKLRDEALPEAQERAGKLAEEEIAPRARKAASSVNSLASTVFAALLPFVEKMVEERVPHIKMAGNKAAKIAKEDVMPAATHAAEETVHKVRDEVLPKMGEAASQAPDMLADIWQIARDKLSAAMDKAGPAVVDAAEGGKHKMDNVASDLQDGKAEIVEAVSSAGKDVTGAMGGAALATGRATRELTGILFWLGVLGALVMLVFVPQRDKQAALWNNTRQFLGEVREMWRDLQGPDQYLDAGDDTQV